MKNKFFIFFIPLFLIISIFSCKEKSESIGTDESISSVVIPNDLTVDELAGMVRESVYRDYMSHIDRPWQVIQSVELQQTEKNTYIGNIISELHIQENPEIQKDEVIVTYDGSTIIWESNAFGKFKIGSGLVKEENEAIVSSNNVKLDEITLTISGREVPFYKIKFSNSTMKYLTEATGISGLGQTSYIPKGYYDQTISAWLLVNKVFKEKRVFTDEEIENMLKIMVYLSQSTQNLTSSSYGTYSFIDANSFPSGQYTSDIVVAKDLQTSYLIVMLMNSTSMMYLNSGISNDYEISGLQDSIKLLSKNISKDESQLFKEVFPGIYKELLIQYFINTGN